MDTKETFLKAYEIIKGYVLYRVGNLTIEQKEDVIGDMYLDYLKTFHKGFDENRGSLENYVYTYCVQSIGDFATSKGNITDCSKLTRSRLRIIEKDLLANPNLDLNEEAKKIGASKLVVDRLVDKLNLTKNMRSIDDAEIKDNFKAKQNNVDTIEDEIYIEQSIGILKKHLLLNEGEVELLTTALDQRTSLGVASFMLNGSYQPGIKLQNKFKHFDQKTGGKLRRILDLS